MHWWVINQLRDMVTYDIKEFIPKSYFENPPKTLKINGGMKLAKHLVAQYQWGYLAGKLALELSSNPNKVMSPRQRAASDLLLDLANLASAEVVYITTSELVEMALKKKVSCLNADVVQRQAKEEMIPTFTKNFHISFRQYTYYLNDLELKPFSELLVSIENPVNLEKYSFKPLVKEDVRNIVSKIVSSFKDLVENKGLWRNFWLKDDFPADEKHAQRLFLGIAHSYCAANNLDVSPETDSGRGSVDFKFSKGHSAKLLLEIKLSSNDLLKGYKNQLEVYKQSNGTDEAIYLVIDTGELSEDKIRQIESTREEFLSLNKKASDIVIIDAKKKLSASKVTNL